MLLQPGFVAIETYLHVMNPEGAVDKTNIGMPVLDEVLGGAQGGIIVVKIDGVDLLIGIKIEDEYWQIQRGVGDLLDIGVGHLGAENYQPAQLAAAYRLEQGGDPFQGVVADIGDRHLVVVFVGLGL